MEDNVFVVVKDIPVGPNGPFIKKGEHVHLIGGVFYSEYGPYPEDVQYMWQNFFKRSDWNKWVKTERF